MQLNSFQQNSLQSSPQTPVFNGTTAPNPNSQFKNLNNSINNNNQISEDRLQDRIFECDFYINEQANSAYNNIESFEYNQAIQIIQNGVVFLEIV